MGLVEGNADGISLLWQSGPNKMSVGVNKVSVVVLRVEWWSELRAV